MFSSTAEYALRAVACLATKEDPLLGSAVIARRTKVPAGYLSKILNDLVNAGIVVSRRGPSGGFALARPPESLSLLEVINAVDPIRRITTCPLNIPAHGKNLCKLHRQLDDAIATVEKALASAVIAELVERGRPEDPFPLEDRKHSVPVMPTIKGGRR